MMIEFVTLEKGQELDAFVRSSPYGHFMQTTAWGLVRSSWDWQGLLCKAADGRVKGTMAILLHRVHGFGQYLLYAPRGPVCDPEDTQTFEELIAAAKEFAVSKRGYILRVDPPVSAENRRFAGMARNSGFSIDTEATFDTFQPKNVYVLPLAGHTEESLLAQMNTKTRYNIRLAQRRGVEIREGSVSDIPAFYELMCITGKRDGFAIRPREDYERLLRLIPGAKLFLAKKDGQLLAGAIGIQMGCHTWYMHGASANEGRQLKPNELLQWTMLRWALQGGCSVYDFRGVEGEPRPDNPGFGLHRFKQGFGSEFVSYVGQMDLTLKPLCSLLIDSTAALKRKAHRLLTRA